MPTRILEGLATTIKNISQILGYLNPLSENFILKDLLDWLNPFSENFFVYKLIELLGDLLEFLFIPSQERLNAFPNLINSKFAFVDSIKYAINSIKDILAGLGNPPVITVPVKETSFTEKGEIEILNLSWYAPFKSYGDLIITGFVYALFIWRLFIAIPGIINGSSGSSGESYTMVYPNMLNSGTKALPGRGGRLHK